MTIDRDTVCAAWRRLREEPLAAPAWLALARGYAARGLAWQADYTARQALRLAPSLHATLEGAAPALMMDAAGDARLGQASLAGADQLTDLLLRAVDDFPGDWLSWLYLARLADLAPAGGRHAAALAALGAPQRAVALEPIAGESLHRLGLWRLNANDHAGAVAALAGLLDLRPIRYGSMMYLGEALLAAGRPDAAEKAFARAALSDHPGFLVTLADRLLRHKARDAALDLLHKALTLQFNAYALGDCRATLARIRGIDPCDAALDHFEANLAERLGDAGTFFSVLRTRCEASGDPMAPYACGLPMAALYDDSLTAAGVAQLHRDACAASGTTLGAAGTRGEPVFANTRDPVRRLRVGWVSGDLQGEHPVNLFMQPLLARLDPARFESIVYDTAGAPPPQPAGGCVRRGVRDLGDEALQRTIAADGIDILVDLAGHTADRRLYLFARRAAPVQASFLGYPHSTGLTTMDWLIGDAVVTPSRHAALYSEGLAQLPGSVFCWAPPAHFPLPPGRPAGAPLVFGSFNNVLKLSPRTVALWSALLRQLPDAHLLLKSAALGDPAVQARYLGLFGACGIAPERLELRGLSELGVAMQEYGDIDIALDPAPYNGGTTTLQALWMGVPVVTLEGHNFAGRMGASFLQALGRPEWVAQDDAGYVGAAVSLARQLGAVRAGRSQLRAHMQASPLADIDAYVGHFEALLQAMWRAWCAGDRRRLLNAATFPRG